jgi:hypothetical protein
MNRYYATVETTEAGFVNVKGNIFINDDERELLQLLPKLFNKSFQNRRRRIR